MAVLAAAAAELGLDVCETPVQPGRNNLRDHAAPAAPGAGLLLLGHTDVVPVGEGWTRDPFGGVVEDGRIYGRGASDMKGGLAASLSAMAALRGAGLSGPVELAALVDEEETGIGIRAYVESATRLVPGLHHRGAHRSADRRRRPRRLLPAGRNPRNRLSRRQSRRRRERDLRRGRGGGRDRAHARASSRSGRTRCWVRRPGASGRSTAAAAASIVPAECVVVADRRLLPGESAAAVLDDLRRRVAGLRLRDRGLTVDVTMPMEMPAFETPADSPLAAHRRRRSGRRGRADPAARWLDGRV